jgi:sugar (pentulose or hexulose) kinase
MRAVAKTGLPPGITVDVTGHDSLDEASAHGSGGGSSVLLEAVIGGLGALVILLLVTAANHRRIGAYGIRGRPPREGSGGCGSSARPSRHGAS